MEVAGTSPFDLVIRGGTVVRAGGSLRADVGIRGGMIAAVGPAIPAEAADAVVDAHGLLVLPGCVDAHTHTRVATDEAPDRFFQDSVAAAFGGTTTFLAFNNPGTGSSEAAARSLRVGLRQWRAATDGDAAIDFAPSLVVTGQMDDPVAEMRSIVDAGVPTAKAFMIFDFRLDDRRLFEAMRALGRAGGMLEVHCEDPVLVDAAVADALQRGNTAARYHVTTRSPEAEAVATHRALEFARAAQEPVYLVHMSSEAAQDEIRRARATGVLVFAETCAHYLALTEERYAAPDEDEVARYLITPPLRPERDRLALWDGLRSGSLDLVGSDHVPDRASVEKRTAGLSFDQISNGAPEIETLLSVVYSEGVAAGRITVERMVDLLATTPARVFGLRSKGSIEVGRDADLVVFDPAATRTVRSADLHHTSDYTPYEGMTVTGAVRSVLVRGSWVVRDGAFVGRRGFGRFVERQLEGVG